MELLEECPADRRKRPKFCLRKKNIGELKHHEVSAACQEICESHSLKKLGFDCFFLEIRPAWMSLPQFFEEAP